LPGRWAGFFWGLLQCKRTLSCTHQMNHSANAPLPPPSPAPLSPPRPADAILAPVLLAPVPVFPVPAQADSDQHLIAMWLHGRSAGTRRAYQADLAGFQAYVAKALRQVTLADLQGYRDTLAGLAPASQARQLSAVKSLLSFGHTLGYLAFNIGAPVRLPAVKQTLAECILAEDDVIRPYALERNPRNHVLLRLLYLCGLRVAEVCGLTWRDLQPRDDSGQVTVLGKGGQTRAVLFKPSIWRQLLLLRDEAGPDAPAFRSRQGPAQPLNPAQVHRIVKQVAARAGLSSAVSAHWLRHARVSHALDHGGPRAPRAGNPRPRQPHHHQPLCPCPAQRQQLPLSARLAVRVSSPVAHAVQLGAGAAFGQPFA